MNTSQIENIIKYVTNDRGDKIEAIVPIDLWYKLLAEIPSSSTLNDTNLVDSGLDAIDENEPKSQILADLQASIRAVKTGDVCPVSEIWHDLSD
jgi:hypothetical protein